MTLTPEQLEAATAPKSISVIASAGTGKTTVLTQRFVHVMQSTALPRIVALTFTEKATREMKERILKKTELDAATLPLLNISTLHGFCSQILREFGTSIGLEEDFTILQEHAHHVWLNIKLQTHIDAKLKEHDDTFLSFYQNYGLRNLKQAMLDLAYADLPHASDSQVSCLNPEFKNSPFHTDFLHKNRELQKALLNERLQNKTLSYDDLENLTLLLLEKHPAITRALAQRYEHLLVDEAQDLSPRQLQIIKFLFQPDKNTLFIVGDPKQSIYGFRDADAEVFSELTGLITQSGGKTITLSKTFRTPQRAQDFFNAVFPKIFKNVTGEAAYTPLETANQSDAGGIYAHALGKKDEFVIPVLHLVTKLLASGTAPSDIAILSSTRAYLTILRDALESQNIPVAAESKASHFDEDIVLLLHHTLLYLSGRQDKLTLTGLLHNPIFNFSEEFIAQVVQQKDRDDSPYEKSWRDFEMNLHLWQNSAQALFPKDVAWMIFNSAITTPDARTTALCLGFIAILESWQTQGYTTVASIVPLLDEFAKSEAEYRVPNPDENGVRLLTIHGAKGLEFDHVLLIPGTTRHGETRVILKNKNQGFLFKKTEVSPGLKQVLVEPEEYIAHKENLKSTLHAEVNRVVYVALTRTKKNLFLFSPPAGNEKLRQALEKKPDDSTGIHDYNNWLAWLARQPQVKEGRSF